MKLTSTQGVPMSELQMHATIEKVSYVPGEAFRLTIVWDHPEISIADLENLNVTIFRIEVERNNLAVSFGRKPAAQNKNVTLEIALPGTLKAGLHAVGSAVLHSIGAEDLAAPLKIQFEPIFFEVRDHFRQPSTPYQIAEMRRALEKARQKYTDRIHQTREASEDLSSAGFFRVTIFGVGCLIHSRQQLDGYHLEPLGFGLSHKSHLELLNVFLKREGCDELPFNEEIETHFQHSTPALAITYRRVQALGHENALKYCREHTRNIFQILGVERGQIPREFACFAQEHGTPKYWHSFEMPGYRGNLVSDFNPTQIANAIETKLPKLETNPFTRLLVRSYAEATGEQDSGFQMLRYWTVLELVADRSVKRKTPILNHDGSSILKQDGKPQTTNSQQGRVYQYILLNKSFAGIYTKNDGGKNVTTIIGDTSASNYQPGMQVISLWEMVQAAYAVRCAVAHEGYFDVSRRKSSGEILASNLLTKGHPDLLDFIKSQAQMAIWRES